MRARKPVRPWMTALRAVGRPRRTRCMTSTAMLRTVLSVLMVYTARGRGDSAGVLSVVTVSAARAQG